MDSLVKQMSCSRLSAAQLNVLQEKMNIKRKKTELPWVNLVKKCVHKMAENDSQVLLHNILQLIKSQIYQPLRGDGVFPKKEATKLLETYSDLITYISHALEDSDIPVYDISRLTSYIFPTVIDLKVKLVGKEKSDIADAIYNKITLLLGQSPELIVDVLLHCKTMIFKNIRQPEIYVPIIRHVFSALRTNKFVLRSMSPELYLKYLVLGKFWLYMTSEKEVTNTRHFIVGLLKMPPSFEPWATQADIPWLKLDKFDTKSILKVIAISTGLKTLYSKRGQTSDPETSLKKKKTKNTSDERPDDATTVTGEGSSPSANEAKGDEIVLQLNGTEKKVKKRKKCEMTGETSGIKSKKKKLGDGTVAPSEPCVSGSLSTKEAKEIDETSCEVDEKSSKIKNKDEKKKKKKQKKSDCGEILQEENSGNNVEKLQASNCEAENRSVVKDHHNGEFDQLKIKELRTERKSETKKKKTKVETSKIEECDSKASKKKKKKKKQQKTLDTMKETVLCGEDEIKDREITEDAQMTKPLLGKDKTKSIKKEKLQVQLNSTENDTNTCESLATSVKKQKKKKKAKPSETENSTLAIESVSITKKDDDCRNTPVPSSSIESDVSESGMRSKTKKGKRKAKALSSADVSHNEESQCQEEPAKKQRKELKDDVVDTAAVDVDSPQVPKKKRKKTVDHNRSWETCGSGSEVEENNALAELVGKNEIKKKKKKQRKGLKDDVDNSECSDKSIVKRKDPSVQTNHVDVDSPQVPKKTKKKRKKTADLKDTIKNAMVACGSELESVVNSKDSRLDQNRTWETCGSGSEVEEDNALLDLVVKNDIKKKKKFLRKVVDMILRDGEQEVALKECILDNLVAKDKKNKTKSPEEKQSKTALAREVQSMEKSKKIKKRDSIIDKVSQKPTFHVESERRSSLPGSRPPKERLRTSSWNFTVTDLKAEKRSQNKKTPLVDAKSSTPKGKLTKSAFDLKDAREGRKNLENDETDEITENTDSNKTKRYSQGFSILDIKTSDASLLDNSTREVSQVEKEQNQNIDAAVKIQELPSSHVKVNEKKLMPSLQEGSGHCRAFDADSDLDIVYVGEAPSASHNSDNESFSERDEASGSDEDIVPCDENNQMFTDAETNLYHQKVLEASLQSKADDILEREVRELRSQENKRSLSPGNESVDEEYANVVSCEAEENVAEHHDSERQMIGDIKDSNLDRILETIVRDTGKESSIEGLREEFRFSSHNSTNFSEDVELCQDKDVQQSDSSPSAEKEYELKLTDESKESEDLGLANDYISDKTCVSGDGMVNYLEEGDDTAMVKDKLEDQINKESNVQTDLVEQSLCSEDQSIPYKLSNGATAVNSSPSDTNDSSPIDMLSTSVVEDLTSEYEGKSTTSEKSVILCNEINEKENSSIDDSLKDLPDIAIINGEMNNLINSSEKEAKDIVKDEQVKERDIVNIPSSEGKDDTAFSSIVKICQNGDTQDSRSGSLLSDEESTLSSEKVLTESSSVSSNDGDESCEPSSDASEEPVLTRRTVRSQRRSTSTLRMSEATSDSSYSPLRRSRRCRVMSEGQKNSSSVNGGRKQPNSNEVRAGGKENNPSISEDLSSLCNGAKFSSVSYEASSTDFVLKSSIGGKIIKISDSHSSPKESEVYIADQSMTTMKRKASFSDSKVSERQSEEEVDIEKDVVNSEVKSSKGPEDHITKLCSFDGEVSVLKKSSEEKTLNTQESASVTSQDEITTTKNDKSVHVLEGASSPSCKLSSEVIEIRENELVDSCEKKLESSDCKEILGEEKEEAEEGDEIEVLSTSGIEDEEEGLAYNTSTASGGSLASHKEDVGSVTPSSPKRQLRKSRLSSGRKKSNSCNLLDKDDHGNMDIPLLKAQRVSEAVLAKEILISPEVSDEECELVSSGLSKTDNVTRKDVSISEGLGDLLENPPHTDKIAFSPRNNKGGIRSPQKVIPEEQDESSPLRVKQTQTPKGSLSHISPKMQKKSPSVEEAFNASLCKTRSSSTPKGTPKRFMMQPIRTTPRRTPSKTNDISDRLQSLRTTPKETPTKYNDVSPFPKQSTNNQVDILEDTAILKTFSSTDNKEKVENPTGLETKSERKRLSLPRRRHSSSGDQSMNSSDSTPQEIDCDSLSELKGSSESSSISKVGNENSETNKCVKKMSPKLFVEDGCGDWSSSSCFFPEKKDVDMSVSRKRLSENKDSLFEKTENSNISPCDGVQESAKEEGKEISKSHSSVIETKTQGVKLDQPGPRTPMRRSARLNLAKGVVCNLTLQSKAGKDAVGPASSTKVVGPASSTKNFSGSTLTTIEASPRNQTPKKPSRRVSISINKVTRELFEGERTSSEDKFLYKQSSPAPTKRIVVQLSPSPKKNIKDVYDVTSKLVTETAKLSEESVEKMSGTNSNSSSSVDQEETDVSSRKRSLRISTRSCK